MATTRKYTSGADLTLMTDEDLEQLGTYGDAWNAAHAAGDQAGMDAAHAGAEALRAKYNYSGGADGSEYNPWGDNRWHSNTQANNNSRVEGMEEFTYESAPTYTSKYQDQIDELLGEILNRPAFEYDPETDPRYAAYRKEYAREGDRATADTMAQYASMTGGMPSTAATAAAQQAGNYYSAQMADKIPELYALAYSMYQDEGDNMRLNIIKNGAGTQAIIANGYSMWRGTVTVNEGGMKLFTANNDLVKVDLILNHGTSLEVAYENPGVHNPSADDMGYIRAGKVEINGDVSILFDASAHPDGGYESDWIKADEVTGGGVATLIIDLDENYFMVDQPVENLELKIFEIENNNYDWAQAIIKIMYKGGDISSNFEKLAYYSEEKENGVYVVLNGIVIPEPAAVAAILGAIAIGFAMLRRRRA